MNFFKHIAAGLAATNAAPFRFSHYIVRGHPGAHFLVSPGSGITVSLTATQVQAFCLLSGLTNAGPSLQAGFFVRSPGTNAGFTLTVWTNSL